MDQDQLSQIFDDICIHGRQVEGWSCENRDGAQVITDSKRGDRWERGTPDERWRASA